MYITGCHRNLGTYCIHASPSCTTYAKVEPFEESWSWPPLEKIFQEISLEVSGLPERGLNDSRSTE
jgi:hypothetical protein